MIYLDHNATTPCAPEVVVAMQRFWSEDFGNPASPHLAGRKAGHAVSSARTQVAALVRCRSAEIIFTSGATESNNLVFLGLLLSKKTERKQVITSAIEHKSVLEPAAFLEERGFEIVQIPVTRDGIVDIEAAKELISHETALVSVQAANNEIGTIQPVAELARLAHLSGAFFHTDAAQTLGKMPVDMNEWGCDFASFSAHKLYGPKGVGALFVSGGARRWPFPYPLRGGGQEGGLRPGTSNVPGIVGFGEACRIAKDCIQADISRLERLTTIFIETLKNNFPNCVIHAQSVQRLPGTVSVAFHGIPGDILIDNIGTLSIGKGSACSSGAIGSSHVLLAIGCKSNIADSTVRISFGRYSTHEQIDTVVEMISKSLLIIKDKLKGSVHAT